MFVVRNFLILYFRDFSKIQENIFFNFKDTDSSSSFVRLILSKTKNSYR